MLLVNTQQGLWFVWGCEFIDIYYCDQINFLS